MRSLLAFVILAASAAPALAGWEYKVVSPSDVEAMAGKGDKKKLESGLNRLGAAGWELAAIEPPTPLGGAAQQPGRMIFKRVIVAKKDAEEVVEVMKLDSVKAADVVKAAAAMFPKAEGLIIVAEEKSNSVLLRGQPDKLLKVGALIAELEKSGKK